LTYTAEAGKIADEGLKYVISLCTPGTKIYEIIQKGDKFIREQLEKCFTKKKFMKSIAYPISIALNEVCGNYNPIEGEETKVPHEYLTLSEGDVVKIDLGVQIEGLPALVSHTLVCSSKNEPVTGKKADIILATYYAIQVALRMMNTNSSNNDITAMIAKVATSFKVNQVEGVLSHRMKRDIIDGPETIINKTTFDQKVDTRKFVPGDIFGLDVIFSTGEGIPKETQMRNTIYKRALETTYKLKSEASRKLLSIIEKNFYTFPFSLSSFDHQETIHLTKDVGNLKNLAKLGVVECVQHELLHMYPILAEKKGDLVAQFKYTVAVKESGPYLVSGFSIDTSKYVSEHKITDEEVIKVLSESWDAYVPNSKKTTKVDKKDKKKDNKEKTAKEKKPEDKKKEEKKEEKKPEEKKKEEKK